MSQTGDGSSEAGVPIGADRNRRWARIALGLAFASPFSWTAGLIAVLLGFSVRRKTAGSPGQSRTRTLAMVAIVWAVLSAFIGKCVVIADADRASPGEFCRVNLSGLGRAMMFYANDHEHRMPLSSQWCDTLIRTDTDITPEFFRCPLRIRVPIERGLPIEIYLYHRWRYAEQMRGPCDYAMNRYADGADIGNMPGDMVLLFESLPSWNQAGGPEVLTMENHGGKGCYVLFTDSDVNFVRPEDLGKLRWKP